MAKVYAVKAGRETGIFHSWPECEKQVKGFSGASYKSFNDIAEAQAFLGLESSQLKKADDELPTNAVLAYVDGTYDKTKKMYGSGVVILWEGKEIKLSEKGDDPGLVGMHNVAGEILGAEIAIRFALQQGIESLVICHDYEGVAKWATGEWNANEVGTKAYKKFCAEANQKMHISFRKVKAHSGDHYNEMADKLAKAAVE